VIVACRSLIVTGGSLAASTSCGPIWAGVNAWGLFLSLPTMFGPATAMAAKATV
jgi:hypothetical protein